VSLGTLVLGLLVVGVVVADAALVVMEVYSKRSSLGCPYPAFAFTWTVVAVVPAAIEACLSRLRSQPNGSAPVSSIDPDDAAVDFTPVPLGTEQQWVVQLAWGIYYAAGTLIYSSIMAVTVIELVVWVIISCFAVGMSKLLAFRLCGNWR